MKPWSNEASERYIHSLRYVRAFFIFSALIPAVLVLGPIGLSNGFVF